MLIACVGVSFSFKIVRASLDSPLKEGAKTLVSVYNGGLGDGTKPVWGEFNTNLAYEDSSDKQNPGKHIAVDCMQADNTEFYIDFGKEYDIYGGKGFSTETLDGFYKKSSVEFWIKLNATPASFFNVYLFQSRGEEYASAPANQRYIIKVKGVKSMR